jgi:hypothetical protein
MLQVVFVPFIAVADLRGLTIVRSSVALFVKKSTGNLKISMHSISLDHG